MRAAFRGVPKTGPLGGVRTVAGRAFLPATLVTGGSTP
jgi:hypothetical protein